MTSRNITQQLMDLLREHREEAAMEGFEGTVKLLEKHFNNFKTGTKNNYNTPARYLLEQLKFNIDLYITSKSFREKNNEILQFIGDNLEHFPTTKEGITEQLEELSLPTKPALKKTPSPKVRIDDEVDAEKYDPASAPKTLSKKRLASSAEDKTPGRKLAKIERDSTSGVFSPNKFNALVNQAHKKISILKPLVERTFTSTIIKKSFGRLLATGAVKNLVKELFGQDPTGIEDESLFKLYVLYSCACEFDDNEKNGKKQDRYMELLFESFDNIDAVF